MAPQSFSIYVRGCVFKVKLILSISRKTSCIERCTQRVVRKVKNENLTIELHSILSLLAFCYTWVKVFSKQDVFVNINHLKFVSQLFKNLMNFDLSFHKTFLMINCSIQLVLAFFLLYFKRLEPFAYKIFFCMHSVTGCGWVVRFCQLKLHFDLLLSLRITSSIHIEWIADFNRKKNYLCSSILDLFHIIGVWKM